MIVVTGESQWSGKNLALDATSPASSTSSSHDSVLLAHLISAACLAVSSPSAIVPANLPLSHHHAQARNQRHSHSSRGATKNRKNRNKVNPPHPHQLLLRIHLPNLLTHLLPLQSLPLQQPPIDHTRYHRPTTAAPILSLNLSPSGYVRRQINGRPDGHEPGDLTDDSIVQVNRNPRAHYRCVGGLSGGGEEDGEIGNSDNVRKEGSVLRQLKS